jgi:putative N6-adenine-specific DNA methylase
MKQAARDRIRTAPAAPAIFASDLAQGAVGKALVNARAAGVDGFVAIERADFLVRAAPAPAGTLITNPPYGVRLADRDKMAAMYPRIGDVLKQRYDGWSAWLLSADTALPKLMHLKTASRTPLFNGALECRLYEYRMRAGRME